jgi:hypothetical protein
MGLASAKPINSRIREDITIVKAIATAKQWVSLRSTHTIRCDENVAYGSWPCENDLGRSATFRHVRGHGSVSRNRPWCRTASKGPAGFASAPPMGGTRALPAALTRAASGLRVWSGLPFSGCRQDGSRR